MLDVITYKSTIAEECQISPCLIVLIILFWILSKSLRIILRRIVQNGHHSSSHHIFNRKIISLTEVYSLFCPYSFNLFERNGKGDIYNIPLSEFLRSAFRYRIDSKYTVLDATASEPCLTQPISLQ